MIDEKKLIDEIKSLSVTITGLGLRAERGVLATFEEEFRKSVLRTIDEQPRVDGWIPCSVSMPPVETEVFILAKRKPKVGDCRYIRTTAVYEDGTVLENDSCWRWEDIEGEWDEENDCYIIPKGWWECRHYNPDDVYNN